MNVAWQRFILALFGFCLLCIHSCYAGPGKPFNKIVFFGDSLSDNGNLYAYDLKYMPKSPPYFEGRFSNNFLWSDVVAEHFVQSDNITDTNFAFGGETAVFHNPTRGFLPYSLTMSRNSYLLRSAWTDRSTTLFIIWIGANDYLHDSVDIDGLSTEVVNSIKANIESLISHGGLDFIVMNLPDAGETPFAKQFGLKDILHNFTVAHNDKLAQLIGELQTNYPDINIQLYDVNSLFADFKANPDYYNKKYKVNIRNFTDACWGGGYTLRSLANRGISEEQIAADIDAHIQTQLRNSSTAAVNSDAKNFSSVGFAHYIATSPDLLEAYKLSKGAEDLSSVPCDNPDEYVFWDHLHPTRVVHMMFADGIEKFIKLHFEVEKKERA